MQESQEILKQNPILQLLEEACQGIEDACDPQELLKAINPQLYEGISAKDTMWLAIYTARSSVEIEPLFDKVASRILLQIAYQEAEPTLQDSIKAGVEAERLTPRLLSEFDLESLSRALKPERDALFPYQGLQTLYDRYFIHINERRIESPQMFWMRIAMGLALNEDEKEKQAIAFYELLSSFSFMCSTPTLFNSGTLHPQLSSCYLSTVGDDLEHIFKVVSDNAMLSKWAGGIGNDWTPVRATNARIRGTNGKSQGVIPFLKVVNDTAVAVNQGGKRKGATCCYLETWHLDIEEFLDLRKNTGDERRRTHDMHTANWIPDLFMERVEEDKLWMLFSPEEVPDLHDLYGKAFKLRYKEYEMLAREGKIKQYREIRAVDLWRKMLSKLFQTGHPWITWKDPSNIRSPQSHKGVVHCSNLCTEIILNTSKEETAVCNLGSLNLLAHIANGKLDSEKLRRTITTATRMLDNVIDINFYPTKEAEYSNKQHRPIGLGIMGFHDALLELNIPYESEEAVLFADQSMEIISFEAIGASAALAKERGAYSSFVGSKWDQGLLPIDTLSLLQEDRGELLNFPLDGELDWSPVREKIKKWGIRNCCLLAVAPTATISQIIGVSPSIDPIYANLFVRSNLSGEFTAINRRLINALKERGLWGREMLDELKYHDGSLQEIKRVPDEIKLHFKTAFEIDSEWLIAAAARRQKWIDMAQSLNLYVTEASGAKLDQMYRLAWHLGLKTTYYLRSRAATQVEKSTLDVNKYGIQPKWMRSTSSSSTIKVVRECSLDESCEACQ